MYLAYHSWKAFMLLLLLTLLYMCVYVQGSQQQAGTLRHRFDDVRPTLLLFLQRLQCIIVNDVTADETSIMVR